MSNKSKGFFAAAKDNKSMAALVVAAVLALGGTAFSVFTVQNNSARDQVYLNTTAELRTLSHRLTVLSEEATLGSEMSFDRLQRILTNMSSYWQQLENMDSSTKIALASEISAVNSVWERAKGNAETIINNKDTIMFMTGVARQLNELLPELQAQQSHVNEVLLDRGASPSQIAMAQMQSLRIERISRNIEKMLSGSRGSADAADQFNLDANLFGKVLTGMLEGDAAMSIPRINNAEAREELQAMSDNFSVINDSIREIFDSSSALFAVRQASQDVLRDESEFLSTIAALATGVSEYGPQRLPNNMTTMAVGGVALILLFLAGLNIYVVTKRRLEETAATNERNQMAILRLLDELADLADGDLTTSATVTEDFTGAIADSINYTIDQLRVLVSRITETSESVSTAAQKTQKNALQLAEASNNQAREIAGASSAINDMATSIDQVSANAMESASVAERSVSIASNGSNVVKNTIHGMDTIREQIQDTSKRIKRLGESSQEIGDIISLITDIADQTNILALNAAIQAAMAGDAGRGFAVVADEVQRLAERSAAATKQIEALVKTIQNDTNEAVISMEQTTSEVVRGARLAQDAGVALEEIESVSTSLADLIQKISNAARQQAGSANQVSNTMNVILDITSQTSTGSSATAESIGNLAEMAVALRQSVAGFTLPESSANSSMMGDSGSSTSSEIDMDMDFDLDEGAMVEENRA